MLRFACFLHLSFLCSSLTAAEPTQAALDHFERRIRPLLVERCVSCHGPKKQESGLRLDSRSSAFSKQEFGTTIIPGNPEASRLIQVIRYHDDDVQMPPKGKLSAADIQLLEVWVKSGAAWPKEVDPASQHDPDAWKTHWAFQPVRRPDQPSVQQKTWPLTRGDHFILAKLEAAGLSPAPQADPRTLVRRASFDLLGLPPNLQQIEQLQQQPTQEQWGKLIEELLASKHFGERWARHWMDVARYSDTTGYVFTADRKLGDAWKYRDWLIHAFNNDMPMDEFLKHQIAVDLILPNDAGDALAATGFLTLGRRFLNNKHDIIDDRIDVMTRGMMGFTVTCARCHDHKYDPIPSADYYSLYGVFASTREPDREKTTVRLADNDRPFNPYVFVRGQAHNHGPRVPRQFLMALTTERKPFQNGSGRLELAEAIASAKNPLTARVFVNRVWGHLFGQHLVETPSDFGVRSNPPSHPQLLDDLASSFVENGWSLKQLIRELVLSRTYQQSSDVAPAAIDPENRLVARMNRKRLDFEAQRDALLSVAGTLDATVGGASVEITSQPFPKRRTVYAHIDRQNLPGVFRAFDLANPDTHSPQRYETTVPQQGLFLLNHPFVMQQAEALAKRTESVTDPAKRIRELYQLTYSREPTTTEIATALPFVTRSREPGSTVTTTINDWAYGYGAYEKTANRVTAFTPYPVHDGKLWKGGLNVPDPVIGWSFLNASGGHPGHKGYAAIRRWIAPASGTLFVRGKLNHPAKEGDGVIGRVVSNRTGQVQEWQVAHRSQEITVNSLQVEKGEVIDFVCESGPTINHDGFEWKVGLRLKLTSGRSRWSLSEKEFSGEPPAEFDVWSQYAQVLLMSNEFVFVD